MEAQCLQKQRVVAAATATSKDAAEPLDDATVHCCEALRGINDVDLRTVVAATPGPVSGGALGWAVTGAINARDILAPDGGEEKLVAAAAWCTTIARAMAVRQQFGQSPTGISAGPFDADGESPSVLVPDPRAFTLTLSARGRLDRSGRPTPRPPMRPLDRPTPPKRAAFAARH